MKQKKATGIVETITIIVQAIIIALVIRTFLFQPFVIPSGSMRPTLLVGDYLFVSKFSYGYSRYSLPFAPNLFSGRIFGQEPKRGDIAVFSQRDVYDGIEKDYIKRVIGLPGDKIQMRDGVLYINNVATKREKIFELDDGDITGENRPVDMYVETLPNGVRYNTQDISPFFSGNNTKEFDVPEGYYFMMGDNRDNSEDSRFSLGYIANENLIGRANLIFFSIKDGHSALEIWRWPFDIRWERLMSFVSTIRYLPEGQESE